MPLYITTANPICGKCTHLLLGGMQIENRYFVACRNEKCEHVQEERSTVWETATGEKIIVRRLVLPQEALEPEMSRKEG